MFFKNLCIFVLCTIVALALERFRDPFGPGPHKAGVLNHLHLEYTTSLDYIFSNRVIFEKISEKGCMCASKCNTHLYSEVVCLNRWSLYKV